MLRLAIPQLLDKAGSSWGPWAGFNFLASQCPTPRSLHGRPCFLTGRCCDVPAAVVAVWPCVTQCVQQVAEVLLRKGRQTFHELLRNINNPSSYTRQQLDLSTPSTGEGSSCASMSAGMLKQVLLVLMQQNCVVTWLQPAEVLVTGTRPAVTIYEADQHQMLQLIRCDGAASSAGLHASRPAPAAWTTGMSSLCMDGSC